MRATNASRTPLAALVVGVALLAPPAAAGASAPAERVAEPAASVRDYWTPNRMRAADPVEPVAPDGSEGLAPAPAGPATYVAPADAGALARARPRRGRAAGKGLGSIAELVPDPTAADVRSHGKVFFTIPKGPEADDYVCSGTAVNARNGSVVWTAGHCVYELTGGGYVTNWTFVPAYQDGAAPYGEWPAKRLGTPTRYQTAEDLHVDLGAAVVARNAGGQRLEEVVGARGIAFDQPRDQTYEIYGYPSDRVLFSGEREYRCGSDLGGTDQFAGEGPPTMWINCNMTEGSSGGGWIANGTLLSVTSYGYADKPLRLYGPYLSSAAKKLYRSASGKRKKRKHHHHNGGKNHR